MKYLLLLLLLGCTHIKGGTDFSGLSEIIEYRTLFPDPIQEWVWNLEKEYWLTGNIEMCIEIAQELERQMNLYQRIYGVDELKWLKQGFRERVHYSVIGARFDVLKAVLAEGHRKGWRSPREFVGSSSVGFTLKIESVPVKKGE